MNKTKKIASNAALAIAVAALLTPSAFADFRHSHETHGRDSGHATERHDRSSGRSETRTFDRGRSNETFRNESRTPRNETRNFRDESRTPRNDSRSFRNDSRSSRN